MSKAPAPALQLTSKDQQLLRRMIHAPTTPQGHAQRARVLLAAERGVAHAVIAREVGVSRNAVMAWRKRYATQGLSALLEIQPGRGRKPTLTKARLQQIIDATLQTKPPGQTHWSCRTMAKAQGVSRSTVQRIWDAHNIQPHRVKTFKLSRDKQFVEKLTDVVGLYMAPPDNAIVLCVDEKTQVQALDRTQPGLPLKPGRCGTMTHDYKRNGTTCLFAAMELLTGHVITDCLPRHRHQEFLKFLRKLDREFDPKQELHLVVDNYGTHNHAKVKAWLARHKRFKLHFVPTSSSWLNLIERWFREITDKSIRRGAFRSVDELIEAINAFVSQHNQDPIPFVWTASVQSILAKIEKCNNIYETLH